MRQWKKVQKMLRTETLSPPAIGVDIVEIDRIRDAHRRFGERFLRRIFLPEEIAHCLRLADPHPSLAARFAAKEAVAKALGTGFGKNLSFHSIRIHTEIGGRPSVHLDASGRKMLAAIRGSRIALSLSHCRRYAVAQALIA
jgi:holo-[acyl-carrier protein] synthase